MFQQNRKISLVKHAAAVLYTMYIQFRVTENTERLWLVTWYALRRKYQSM